MSVVIAIVSESCRCLRANNIPHIDPRFKSLPTFRARIIGNLMIKVSLWMLLSWLVLNLLLSIDVLILFVYHALSYLRGIGLFSACLFPSDRCHRTGPHHAKFVILTHKLMRRLPIREVMMYRWVEWSIFLIREHSLWTCVSFQTAVLLFKICLSILMSKMLLRRCQSHSVDLWITLCSLISILKNPNMRCMVLRSFLIRCERNIRFVVKSAYWNYFLFLCSFLDDQFIKRGLKLIDLFPRRFS